MRKNKKKILEDLELLAKQRIDIYTEMEELKKNDVVKKFNDLQIKLHGVENNYVFLNSKLMDD